LGAKDLSDTVITRSDNSIPRSDFVSQLGATPEELLGELARFARRANLSTDPPLLVGDDHFTQQAHALLTGNGIAARVCAPNAEDMITLVRSHGSVIYCQTEHDADDWVRFGKVTAADPLKVKTVWEIARNLIVLKRAARGLEYYYPPARTLDTYLDHPSTLEHSKKFMSFHESVSFRDKRVVEFGPMDASHTAAFLNLGAKSVTCIEIRPENYIKVALAKELNAWSNVSLSFDNFHAVTRERYGMFDICVANGVYYHSDAPFVFLRNLAGLSAVLFLGGFCATEKLPDCQWIRLKDSGRDYLAKPYAEVVDHYTAGVGNTGFFFKAESLLSWLTDNGYSLLKVERSEALAPTGEYAWIHARRGR